MMLLKFDLGDDELGETLVPSGGELVEGEAEGFGFAGREAAFVGSDDGDAFAGEGLAVGVGEDAGELDELDLAIPFIGDFSVDFDDAMGDEAVGGFHVDFGEVEVADVLFGFGGDRGGAGVRLGAGG